MVRRGLRVLLRSVGVFLAIGGQHEHAEMRGGLVEIEAGGGDLAGIALHHGPEAVLGPSSGLLVPARSRRPEEAGRSDEQHLGANNRTFAPFRSPVLCQVAERLGDIDGLGLREEAALFRVFGSVIERQCWLRWVRTRSTCLAGSSRLPWRVALDTSDHCLSGFTRMAILWPM